MATCPAHDDTEPSLHVTWKDRPGAGGGLTAVYCHGCKVSATELTNIIGLTEADLFDEPLQRRVTPGISKSAARRAAGRRRGRLGRLPDLIAATPTAEHDHGSWVEVDRYRYTTAEGQPVQEVVRQECADCAARGTHTKRFKQLFADGGGRLVTTAPEGFRRVLYRAPEVAEAIGRTAIYLLEGEKDVATAEGLGLVATTNTQGGLAFPEELAAGLTGADVIVVLDRDPTGWARGVDLHAKLTAAGATVHLRLPAVNVPKADFTDHVNAGHEPGDLVEVHVDEVATWHALTAVLEKRKLFDQAIREALARQDRADAGDEQAQNERYAKRWAMEAQIRHEALQHAVEHVDAAAIKTGTGWSVEALDLAGESLREASDEGYRCHRRVGLPIPPTLRLLEPAPAEVDTPFGNQDSRASSEQRPHLRVNIVTPEVGWGTAGASAAAPMFRVLDGQIVQWSPGRGRGSESEGEFKVLLSTVVRVTAREYLEAERDSDVEAVELLGRADPERKPAASPRPLVAVRVEYPDPDTGEHMEIRVHADHWRDHSWLESLPGSPDYDHKRAGLDQLQRAILAISPDISDEILFRSTGWRETRDGRHEFIHRRGAITADGHRSTEVAFAGPLQRYDLPDPSRDPEVLRRAWLDGSATMLDRLPDRVGAPVLGQVYRSVLGHNEWVLTLVGPPGSYKTSVAAKAMQHFGERWDHTKPTSSMSGNGDTFNALRLKLHHAKDALYWMDDFAPTKSWLDAQKTLEESARLVHNQEERSRASRDGLTISDGTGPRASALCTSEVMPRPGSAADRMLVVPLARDEVDTDMLFPLDEALSRYWRALVMSSFISWLAADLTTRRQRYFTMAAEYADVLVRRAGETVRQAAAISHTWVGWVAVTDFLSGVGAITAEERDQTLRRVDAALHEAGRAAHNPDMPRTTGARVVELLAYALRQGIAHVDDVRDGQCPPWPLAGRLGWRETVLDVDSYGQAAKRRYERNGIRLGYVLHDPGPRERGRLLMCDSTQLEAVLKAASGTQAEKLEIDRNTACRALRDEGVLIADESEGRARHTIHCRIYAENRSARMVALHLDKVIGDDQDDPDATEPASGPDPEPGRDPSSDEAAIPGFGDNPHPLDEQHLAEDRDLGASHHESAGGSNQPDEEEYVSTEWADRDGTVAWTERPGGEALPCVVCGRPCSIVMSGHRIHPPCWAVTSAADRAATAPAPPKELAGAHHPPASPQPVATAEFRSAAAVVDVDGIWLTNGEHLAMPGQGPQHIGDLVRLAEWLRLGTFVTKERKDGRRRRRAAGQIWVADGLARALGIDVDAITSASPQDIEKTTKAVTAGITAITAAAAEGFHLGGGGDGLGRWTRVWMGHDRSIWVVLVPALGTDARELPLVAGKPDNSTLARRIGLLADALSYPYHLSASTTGLDLMSDLRFLDREHLFGARPSLVEPEEVNIEADLSWCRPPTAEEKEHTWVHAYDRSGSYLAGVSGLELGIGEPVHHANGREFDPKLPGYWLAEIPEPGDWRMPHPLDPRGRFAGKVRWLTTPSVEFATQQGYELDIREAYTWPEHGRILDAWYERIRDARTALDTDDQDAQLAREQLKQIYASTIGMLGSHIHLAGRPGYAPARRHMIIAKARTNILRRVVKIGEESGRWPVAVVTDTVLYTSSEADPVKAWPGGEQWLGRALGRYKVEGSAPLEEHLQWLTGGMYRGKDSIVTPRIGSE